MSTQTWGYGLQIGSVNNIKELVHAFKTASEGGGCVLVASAGVASKPTVFQAYSSSPLLTCTLFMATCTCPTFWKTKAWTFTTYCTKVLLAFQSSPLFFTIQAAIDRNITKILWPFYSLLLSDANKPSRVPHSLTDFPASENWEHPAASQDFKTAIVLQAGTPKNPARKGQRCGSVPETLRSWSQAYKYCRDSFYFL